MRIRMAGVGIIWNRIPTTPSVRKSAAVASGKLYSRRMRLRHCKTQPVATVSSVTLDAHCSPSGDASAWASARDEPSVRTEGSPTCVTWAEASPSVSSLTSGLMAAMVLAGCLPGSWSWLTSADDLSRLLPGWPFLFDKFDCTIL
jgi:hypothetical protein